MSAIPARLRWLFWNVDLDELDTEKRRSAILARILERGRLEDVRWAVRRYGLPAIRAFFQSGAHPEVSRRTRLFWKAALEAEEETWPEAPAWRASSGAPWID